MSEGATTEPVRKDFRSSYYYKSLNGYKGGERGLGHLEVILGMEVLGRQLDTPNTNPNYVLSNYCTHGGQYL